MTADQLTLTNYIDILDHLEASGNVPAGYTSITGDSAWWRFRDEPLSAQEEFWEADLALAIASLCYTIEDAIHLLDGTMYADPRPAVEKRYHVQFGPNGDGTDYYATRLEAAAAAYRTFIVEQA